MQLKRTYIIISLLLAISASFVYLFLSRNPIAPAPLEISNPLNKELVDSLNQPENQTVNLPQQQLPTTVKISPTISNPLSDEAIRSLAEKVGHSEIEIENGIGLYEKSDSKQTLLINSHTKTFIYYTPFSFSREWSDEQFTKTASDLVFNLIDNTGVWQSPKSFVERSPGEHGHLGAITVHFFPTIDNIRITSNTRLPLGDSGIAKVTFHSHADIVSINIEFINIELENSQTIELIKQKEVEASIANGNSLTTGIYPLTNQAGSYRESPYVPKTAHFNNFELLYLYDAKTPHTYLQPIFLASGQAIVSTGEKVVIKTVVSGVKKE